jgi:hypothetical protein
VAYEQLVVGGRVPGAAEGGDVGVLAAGQRSRLRELLDLAAVLFFVQLDNLQRHLLVGVMLARLR